jgi:hypothetical protein
MKRTITTNVAVDGVMQGLGGSDEDAERRILEECPRVDLMTVAGSGHFIANLEPGLVAELVVAALERAG